MKSGVDTCTVLRKNEESQYRIEMNHLRKYINMKKKNIFAVP